MLMIFVHFADLHDIATVSPTPLQEVDTAEARAYAEEIGAMFVETSAKEDTHVQDIFVELSKRLPAREPPPPPPPADTLNLGATGSSSSSCC